MRGRLAMTLVAWLAAFAVVMALLAVFGDLLAALPMAARAAVISGVLVTVMVNVVMPRLSNAGDLIASLRRSYPEQFGLDHSNAGSIDAAAGRHPAPPLTREALGRMTPAEIRELEWEEVRAALAGQ